MSLWVSSPAKINLFLYVTAKRPDGYHDLCSLMCKVGLVDEMAFKFKKDKIAVSCSDPRVPSGPQNLAHKAAVLFADAYQKKCGLPMDGVDIFIEKKIPMGGGLGGGSGNAATVLSTLNRECGQSFSTRELLKLGLQIGADVPFFIFGGPALARGVGEKLTRIPDLPPLWVVLCNPGIHGDTAQVFKNLDFKLTSLKKQTINTVSNVLPQGQGREIRQYLYNDLEASACKLYPEIQCAKEEMASVLKTPVTMTGSGACLFALFEEHSAARNGAEKLERYWAKRPYQVVVTSLQNG